MPCTRRLGHWHDEAAARLTLPSRKGLAARPACAARHPKAAAGPGRGRGAQSTDCAPPTGGEVSRRLLHLAGRAWGRAEQHQLPRPLSPKDAAFAVEARYELTRTSPADRTGDRQTSRAEQRRHARKVEQRAARGQPGRAGGLRGASAAGPAPVPGSRCARTTGTRRVRGDQLAEDDLRSWPL